MDITEAIEKSIKILVSISCCESCSAKNTLMPRVKASIGKIGNDMKIPSLRAFSNAAAPMAVGIERIKSHPWAVSGMEPANFRPLSLSTSENGPTLPIENRIPERANERIRDKATRVRYNLGLCHLLLDVYLFRADLVLTVMCQDLQIDRIRVCTSNQLRVHL